MSLLISFAYRLCVRIGKNINIDCWIKKKHVYIILISCLTGIQGIITLLSELRRHWEAQASSPSPCHDSDIILSSENRIMCSCVQGVLFMLPFQLHSDVIFVLFAIFVSHVKEGSWTYTSTINICIGLLKTFFSSAVEQGLYTSIPLCAILNW